MINNNRKEKTKKIITKRVKHITTSVDDYESMKQIEQPNRLNKQKAFGCSSSNCKICNCNKKKDEDDITIKKDTYCNQCGFVGDDEDFKEHIAETSHTGYKGNILVK